MLPASAPRRPSRPADHRAAFLRRALIDQAGVGAIAPTSATLARRLARLVPADPGARVLELGAGSGPISAAIGPRLGPGAVHVAVERDVGLLDLLADVAPWARRVHADAADVVDHPAVADLGGVDVVLSSLPWSNLDAVLQRRILDAVRLLLVPGGTFATIAYRPTRLNPGSRRFRRLLEARFTHVVATSTTWANLPPARLLVAHGTRSGSGCGVAPPASGTPDTGRDDGRSR